MDFGSSHVYAGDKDKTYYSSVPIDLLKKQDGNVASNPKGDPIYESLEIGKPKKEAEYDEVPQTKNGAPPIPAKPKIYQKESLSDKLRKALKDREIGQQKAPKQPKQPNIPLPPIPKESATQQTENAPPSIPPRTRLTPKQSPGKANIPKIDKKSSSEGKSWQGSLAEIPSNTAKVVPVPSSIPLLETPSMHVTGNISETLLPPARPEGSAFPSNDRSNLFSSSNSCIDENQFSSWLDLFDVPTYSNTNPFLQNLEVPWDSDLLKTTSGKQEAVPNSYHTFAGSGLQRMYPTLPSAIDDEISLKDSEPVIPSAPQPTDSMVREQAELFQQQMKDMLLNGNPNGNLDNQPDAIAQSMTSQRTLVMPSAPRLSHSMIRRDFNRSTDNTQAQNSGSDQSESVYSSADTNIVCVKLGIVGEKGRSHAFFGAPIQCIQCGAIHTNLSGEWTCEFCHHTNNSNCPTVPLSSANDVTYLLQPTFQQPGFSPESLVVLCIDTSGSMCVSSQVATSKSQNSIFMSRLQGVQQAIYNQLNRIAETSPTTRVALVTFSDMVQLLGDGSPNQHISLSDVQLFDFDFLRSVGASAILPGPIHLTRGKLDNAVSNLKERGGTALGPALLLSTSLASQVPGSQVIVCTDGRANVGIGSLESESDYQLCHHFYNQTTELASKSGVIVSILSIAGTDCRLVELGKVANKTSGKVSIVNATEISEKFENILTDTVLATNVSIDLVTHKQLYFSNIDGTTGSNITEFVGNITNQSEITVRYGINKDGEFADVVPPKEAPFQLKIMYRPPDGSVCLRVITQIRPVTESRELAESEMNLAVVGAYASHSAAKLALEGDIEHAKEVTDAHKDLLFRGMSLRSNASTVVSSIHDEKIYECVKNKIDDIGRELAKVDVSSSSESLNSPDVQDCEVGVYEGLNPPTSSGMVSPPALPPRGATSPLRSKSSSLSSFEGVLSRLPSIPKNRIKKKKNKKKVAEQYRDETAQKMFNFSKVTTRTMATPQ